MALQVTMLQDSFNAIAPCGEAFVATFYERLFAAQPHIRQFFANTSMEDQHHKLLMSLVLVIENLNKPEYLAGTLRRLGAIHASHKVQAEHFDMVGSALLATFADYLQSGWTPELHAAWSEAYQTLTAMMLAGY